MVATYPNAMFYMVLRCRGKVRPEILRLWHHGMANKNTPGIIQRQCDDPTSRIDDMT